MGRGVLIRIAAGVAVAASLALGTVGTASASGAAEAAAPASSADANRGGGGGRVTPNAELPEMIRVDETTFKLVATLHGEGKQVYDCVNGAYAFREPIATLEELRGNKKIVGIHGAGPFWASFDGSKVIGTGAVSVPSPAGTPPNIAWLRLSVASTAGKGGVFSNVAFIQRTDTRGGSAPATCGPPTVAVEYSTIYQFWAPK
jgi:Protein of unknown function (DUF3455)